MMMGILLVRSHRVTAGESAGLRLLAAERDGVAGVAAGRRVALARLRLR